MKRIVLSPEVEQERMRKLASQATRTPKGKLVLTSVGVFDARSGKVVPNQQVTIRGNRIASVMAQGDGRSRSRARRVREAGPRG